MRRFTLGFASVLLLFLGATLIAQNTKLQTLQVRSETKGTFDRRTGELKLKERGLGRNKFASFETFAAGFEERGYSEEALDRLKTILSNTYQGGDDITVSKPGILDGIVEIDEDVPIIKFALSAINSDSYATFEAVLVAKKDQSGCQKFSSSCVRCPDGKKYCYVKNLLKPGVSASARQR